MSDLRVEGPLHISIGPFLKSIIWENGFSIGDYAKLIGFTESALHQQLSPEKDPKRSTITKIISPLGYRFELQRIREQTLKKKFVIKRPGFKSEAK